jgi:hypothetical protein
MKPATFREVVGGGYDEDGHPVTVYEWWCKDCYVQPKPPKYTKIIWTFKVDSSVWYDPVRRCTKGVYNLTEAELEEKCCTFDGELYWKDSIPLSLQ